MITNMQDHQPRIAWRVVHPDFTSRNGFRWPFPGRVAAARGPFTTGCACPTLDGDGLCLAKTFTGAALGGIHSPVVLVCSYLLDDVLGEDLTKVRVKQALVLDVWDLWRIVREGGSAADLRSADLTRANLTDANLTGADLRSADLTRANLHSADLHSADLRSADLHSAYLTGANLTGADLRSAYLIGANLTGADLTGADLRSTYLTGAKMPVGSPTTGTH